MKGRKRICTAEHERKGTYATHPERRRSLEPNPPTKRPTKPHGLDGIASRKWDFLVELLAEMDMPTTANADLIELYCRTFSAWRHAELATIEWHKCGDKLIRLLAEMGLTPSSRSRVQAAGTPKPEDPLEKFGIVS